MNMSERQHFVNIWSPKDVTGGVVGDRFTMANHRHATIHLAIGVSAGAPTKILVKNCTAFSGGTATAIAFNIYKEETDGGDTLGARTAVLAAGTTPSANDNIFYVIELDASELTDGYEFVEISMTNASQEVFSSCVAILSGARYGKSESLTAIV